MARRADRLEALAQRLCDQHGVSARVLIADLPEDGGIDANTSSIQSESELAVTLGHRSRIPATTPSQDLCSIQLPRWPDYARHTAQALRVRHDRGSNPP
jgi:hypothetical protein